MSFSLVRALPVRLSLGPWLWGATLDLSLFAGSAALALGLLVVGTVTGLTAAPLPEWTWLFCVLAVDVAHVYSTLFRTYFDREELRARPVRYVAVPLAAYAGGVALYAWGSLVFWRVLAYLALWHFVRQQVGWVAVYRARAGQRARLDRALDELAVYAATLYPVLHWHAFLSEAQFAWFVAGDFVAAEAWARAALPGARLLWQVALGAFVLRQLQLAIVSGTLHLGKSVVVATTALTWYIGIVATNSDYAFTVTNVLVHGIPYLGLLFAYARARRQSGRPALGSLLIEGGVAAFCGCLLLLAFVEEMAWDRLVWHDRPWLFGAGETQLGELALTALVPLLALPQLVHYVLDGLLWRRGETRRLPAQREALGFAMPPGTP